MVDAPETIGLVSSPFGFRLWNREEDDSEATAIRYLRADIAERQIAEMSERFRAVNIAEVIRQSGNDFVAQAERIAALEVERDRLAAELQGIAKRWPDSAAAKSARAALASVKE